MRDARTRGIAGFAATAVAATMTAGTAQGGMIDLSQNDGGELNGALFEWVDAQSTGTGVIDPFVRVHADGTEEGYNTSGSPVPLDAKQGSWTHDLRLGDVPVVSVAGRPGAFYQFLLDINETRNHPLLSLDELRLYTSDSGSATTAETSSLGLLQYSLDAGADNHILLDFSRNPGSGAGDMFAYFPTSMFEDASEDDYVYLYSKFGLTYGSDDGFEEWAVMVPEPGSLLLIGVAAALGSSGRRRRQRGT